MKTSHDRSQPQAPSNSHTCTHSSPIYVDQKLGPVTCNIKILTSQNSVPMQSFFTSSQTFTSSSTEFLPPPQSDLLHQTEEYVTVWGSGLKKTKQTHSQIKHGVSRVPSAFHVSLQRDQPGYCSPIPTPTSIYWQSRSGQTFRCGDQFE